MKIMTRLVVLTTMIALAGCANQKHAAEEFKPSVRPDRDVYVDITVDCAAEEGKQIFAQTRNQSCDGWLDKDPEGLVCQKPSGFRQRFIIWESASEDKFKLVFKNNDHPFTNAMGQCRLDEKTTEKRCKVKKGSDVSNIFIKYDIVFDGCARDPHIFLRR